MHREDMDEWRFFLMRGLGQGRTLRIRCETRVEKMKAARYAPLSAVFANWPPFIALSELINNMIVVYCCSSSCAGAAWHTTSRGSET